MRTLKRNMTTLQPRRVATLAEHANGARRLSASVKDRQKLRVWLKQNARCNACGGIVALPDADLDHIKPLAGGGGTDDDNCQVLHRAPCHKDKTAGEITERAKRSDLWTSER